MCQNLLHDDLDVLALIAELAPARRLTNRPRKPPRPDLLE